jgi:hypothetical protein
MEIVHLRQILSFVLLCSKECPLYAEKKHAIYVVVFDNRLGRKRRDRIIIHASLRDEFAEAHKCISFKEIKKSLPWRLNIITSDAVWTKAAW